jgi:hypothetical protein
MGNFFHPSFSYGNFQGNANNSHNIYGGYNPFPPFGYSPPPTTGAMYTNGHTTRPLSQSTSTMTAATAAATTNVKMPPPLVKVKQESKSVNNAQALAMAPKTATATTSSTPTTTVEPPAVTAAALATALASAHNNTSYHNNNITSNNRGSNNNNLGNTVNNNNHTIPRTPLELRLLSELRSIGFRDRRDGELLMAIRHFCPTTTTSTATPSSETSDAAATPIANTNAATTTTKTTTASSSTITSDEVMLYIIEQRDLADEAILIDEARRQSELLKNEDADRKKLAEQASLESATLDEWKQIFFPHSWILEQLTGDKKNKDSSHNNKNTYHDNARIHSVIQETLLQSNEELLRVGRSSSIPMATMTMSPFKASLLELLKLEKKARQWYRSLPAPFFQNWCHELMERFSCQVDAYHDPTAAPSTTATATAASEENHSTLVLWVQLELEAETALLQDGMFALSQQNGNVPSIFVTAYDEAKARGGIMDGDEEEEDDDDVIMVIPTPTSHTSSTAMTMTPLSTTSTKAKNGKSSPAARKVSDRESRTQLSATSSWSSSLISHPSSGHEPPQKKAAVVSCEIIEID